MKESKIKGSDFNHTLHGCCGSILMPCCEGEEDVEKEGGGKRRGGRGGRRHVNGTC